jgi:hypothetical protein
MKCAWKSYDGYINKSRITKKKKKTHELSGLRKRVDKLVIVENIHFLDIQWVYTKLHLILASRKTLSSVCKFIDR